LSSFSARSTISSSVGLTDATARTGAALVTGGGRRIGRAIALSLAEAGFDVAIHYRSNAAEAEAVATEVRALGRRAAIVQADLTAETQVRTLIPAAVAALGPLSVLVNNASVFEDDRVGALGRDTWDLHLDTNLRAPIVLAEVFASQAPAGSAIVNLLDQRVLKPDPRFFSYALSRNGLWWATRTLAQALAPGIRVNGVGPGPTLASIHQTAEEFAAEAAGTPLQRPGSPEAIAAAVLWLVDADMVTGQMIAVDGGQHLAWQTPDIVDFE
jgi:NAD(P)-dependent dehydrogenase (short-subunit alcohol dehydrogenase family)